MRPNGFTLVELMVVIAILAMAAGAVVLASGTAGGGPDEGAARFASRLAAARDEAIVSGRPLGAWASASGYGFERYRDGRWEAVAGKPFRTENWPAGTNVRVAGETRDGLARVRFDTLGIADSELSVRLARGGRTVQVRVAANGDVVVE